MTIHDSHPFADPDPDPVRRLRGRLGGRVALVTSGEGTARAGLTVSSLVVVAGEPARVLAILDPDSDLADSVERTGRGVVQLLDWHHRDLAEAFAGTAPAPGGPFRAADFEDTAWGPHLADAGTWAGTSLESAVDVGWSRLFTLVIESVALGLDDDALEHRRGRYHRAPGRHS